jgi:alkylated DNA nucleotide flippase Atl1
MEPEALARFARGLARLLESLAEDLVAGAAESELELQEAPLLIGEGRRLGSRQRAILELTGLSDDSGMKTSEIADAIHYEVPNTYMTLRALAGSGLLEQIPGVSPQRWRLAPRYRATAAPYVQIAAHVHRGEWTTYGDISIAHRGDARAARAVGRAAATLPSFPHPHRVLGRNGVIPIGWRDDQGNGPEECRRRLESEGVRFSDDGRADPASRVAWDILASRFSQECS